MMCFLARYADSVRSFSFPVRRVSTTRGAGWKVMMELLDAEYARPDRFLPHVSDTHFVSTGLLYGEVDAQARLAEIFATMEASGLRPEAIVFTGGLADKGEPEAYRKLRRAAEAAATKVSAELIRVVGNHALELEDPAQDGTLLVLHHPRRLLDAAARRISEASSAGPSSPFTKAGPPQERTLP